MGVRTLSRYPSKTLFKMKLPASLKNSAAGNAVNLVHGQLAEVVNFVVRVHGRFPFVSGRAVP